MPELPDIELYLRALRLRVPGQIIEGVNLASPFLVRTFDPPIEAVVGKCVSEVRRMGKRIVLGLEGDLFFLIHLMIAGRLRWDKPGARIPAKIGLGAIHFATGTLLLTEAGSKKRAGLWLVRGQASLRKHDPGGIDPLAIDCATFMAALRRENHTLKRVLTDPRVLSGVGNAYSDEILHAARLSPVQLTGRLTDEDATRLHEAMQRTLREWTARLAADFGDRFPGPGDVTAFRPDFAVHGRFGKPCPVCRTTVQRIRYAENETNYCPRCQTGGKMLADRSLSRLLKNDWPKSIDEVEE